MIFSFGQNELRPQDIEKIVSTFDRFADVERYARVVPLHEIASAANDFNLNIRRYVDNSPPPEPHDVRAHLLGGVPVAEVEAQRPLFDALGFDPTRAFAARPHDPAYHDFHPALTDRAALRPLVENDPGVQARLTAVRSALAAWWAEHSPRLADLPRRRDLNAVRHDLLDSFVAALQPLHLLDEFQLAGVIAAWWTDTLPDLKTLLENGFPGVLDGWVDAIADAVEDDDHAGPAFDPFGHKLVRCTMSDYLERIVAAKADIARLKGEKEAFEQSNAPEDADEEELAAWNYARDLERRLRELRPRRAGRGTKAADTPPPPELAALEAALQPYETIKQQLAEARARYRTLTDDFVNELKSRCGALNDDQKRALVLELFAQDVLAALDAAIAEKRQHLVRFLENLWDKYRVTLEELRASRSASEVILTKHLHTLGFL